MIMQLIQSLIQMIQTVVVISGFFYTIRALRQANDSRNVDFIIQAEGQIDPLFTALMADSPSAIRAVLPELIPRDADDIGTKRYIYTYFAYRHLSRIIYMLSNNAISLGMSGQQRTEFVEDWINELKKYDQGTVRSIHSYCRTTGEFNDIFLSMMDNHYLHPHTD
jgi:hypothetical protein